MLQELFSSHFGWLSLFTILFVVVMAFYFMRFFSNHIAEDERKMAKQQRERSSAKT
jgi:NADH:ubiquinone oxidoreductase subunit 2 (subunit N)